jgi:nucleotide-binding universal stress UspA family protein
MYQKILTPLDGSEFAECSLAHVKAIAGGCQVPEIVLLRVVEPIHSSDLAAYAEANIDTESLMQDVKSAATVYIDKVTEVLKRAGLPATGVIVTGPAADSIMKYAEENKVDLIIMSTHGRSGISRWFMGSVADKIVRHSSIPVLTVAPPGCKRVAELPSKQINK